MKRSRDPSDPSIKGEGESEGAGGPASDSVASRGAQPPSNKRARIRAPRAVRPHSEQWRGRSMSLEANFFPLSTDDDTIRNTLQYDVKFYDAEKDGEGKWKPGPQHVIPRARGVALLHSLPAIHDSRPWSFDGSSLYVMGKSLPEEVTSESDSNPVLLQDPKFPEIYYLIVIRRVTVRSTDRAESTEFQSMLLNNMAKKMIGAQNNLVQMGRHLFDTKHPISVLDNQFSLFPGFKTAIKTLDCGPTLNLDLVFKMVANKNMADALHECEQKRMDRQQISAQFEGKIVMTRYNNRTYKLSRIDWDDSPAGEFDQKGQKISYAEHAKRAYNVVVQKMNQPMFVSETKRRSPTTGQQVMNEVRLIPEFCFMTGVSSDMGYTQMSALRQLTAVPGPERKNRIETLVSGLQPANIIPSGPRSQRVKEEGTALGFKLAPNFLRIDAKVLDTNRIALQGNTTAEVADGSFNNIWQSSKKMLNARNLSNWRIYFLPAHQNAASNLAETMIRLADPMGFRIAPPKPISVSTPSGFIDALKQINPGDNVEYTLCVLPNKNANLYNAIKEEIGLRVPVPNQCVTASNIMNSQRLLSLVSGVLQQLQAKIGGVPWAVTDISPPIPVMVVGISFSRSKSSGSRQKTAVGFVASINSNFTGYWTSGDFAEHLGEGSTVLGNLMKGAVTNFNKLVGVPPKNIIVYREGVGDGQIDTVIEVEVGQLKQALQEIECSAGLTFICVENKSIARFLGDRGSNPPPGTVVDKGCVQKDGYDFYLISQKPKQGAVAPTHYNVLYDTCGMSPDRLQTFTFQLCHLYYNWLGTIATPAPLRYAYVLATKMSSAVHGTQHPAHNGRLWFI